MSFLLGEGRRGGAGSRAAVEASRSSSFAHALPPSKQPPPPHNTNRQADELFRRSPTPKDWLGVRGCTFGCVIGDNTWCVFFPRVAHAREPQKNKLRSISFHCLATPLTPLKTTQQVPDGQRHPLLRRQLVGQVHVSCLVFLVGSVAPVGVATQKSGVGTHPSSNRAAQLTHAHHYPPPARNNAPTTTAPRRTARPTRSSRRSAPTAAASTRRAHGPTAPRPT